MDHQQACKIAEDWLRAHGYAQFSDGVWHYHGYMIDPLEVLTEYIKEIHNELGSA